MEKSLTLKLAGAVALAGSSQAYGQILPLTLPTNVPGVPPDGSENSEFYTVLSGITSGSPTGADFKFEYYNGSSYFFTGATPIKLTTGVAVNYPGGFYDSAIAFGTKIGTDTYSFTKGFGPGASPSNLTVLAQSYPGGPVTSYMQPNTPTYLGFQFADGSGNIHDGYLELESATYTSPTSPGGLLFLSGAYNATPDIGDGLGDVTAGEAPAAAPEPSTLSALVLGAAALGGIGLARRRRTALVTAQD
jgi:hypothetical protein